PKAPYGYQILRTPERPRGELRVDEEQARYVREMFRWVVEEGLSARQVTARLNQRQVKPPCRAHRWIASTVYHLLVNPVYAGQAVFNRREAVEPRRAMRRGEYRKVQKSSHRVRPKEQWLRVPVPALVSAA